jgi:hypothetical protein
MHPSATELPGIEACDALYQGMTSVMPIKPRIKPGLQPLQKPTWQQSRAIASPNALISRIQTASSQMRPLAILHQPGIVTDDKPVFR